MRVPPVLAAGGLVLLGGGLAAIWLWRAEPSFDDDPRTIALGEQLYAEHCAACHGANLEGEPDWETPLPSGRLRAPPHDTSGHTWHHSDDLLFRITKEGMEAVADGAYDSNMPAFGAFLDDEEIRAVLAFIKSTWSERERRYQEEMTRRERATAR